MRDIYLRAKGRTVIWRGDMLVLIYHNSIYVYIYRSCKIGLNVTKNVTKSGQSIIGKSVYIYYLDDMILFAKFYSGSLLSCDHTTMRRGSNVVLYAYAVLGPNTSNSKSGTSRRIEKQKSRKDHNKYTEIRRTQTREEKSKKY